MTEVEEDRLLVLAARMADALGVLGAHLVDGVRGGSVGAEEARFVWPGYAEACDAVTDLLREIPDTGGVSGGPLANAVGRMRLKVAKALAWAEAQEGGAE